MALSLKSIAEGTSATLGNAVKDTARKAMSAVPNPAAAVENLGLGVGTLVRNIKEASKKEKKPATEVEQKKGVEQTTKKINQMTAQLALSNSLLKEIRNLQIKQLTAVGKQGKGMTGGAAGRRLLQASNDRLIKGAEPTYMQRMLDKPETKDDSSSAAKLGMGAVGLFAMWKLLPDEMKDALGGLATNIAKDLKPVLVDGIGEILHQAWNKSPVYTTLATLLVAQVTGVLGLATNTAKGLIGAYKLTDKMAGPAKASAVEGAPIAAAQQTAPKVSKNVAAAAAEYNSLVNSPNPSDRYGAGAKVAEKYKLNEAQLSQAKSVAVEPVAPKTPVSGISKMGTIAKGIGIGGALVSTGLGAAEYYQAGEAEKRGEINRKQAAERKGGAVGGTVGTLAGGVAGAAAGGNIGMALGAGIGALFGGVGAVPGAAIGRVLGSLAGGYFGATQGGEAGNVIGSTLGGITRDDTVQQQGKTAVNNATATRADAAQSLKIIREVFASRGFSEEQIRAAQIVAAAESGLNPSSVGDNGASIGLFQLNRVAGEGRGRSVEELMDPVTNATIAADKMKTDQGNAFRKSTTVEEAIVALTRDFERPSFVSGNQIADVGKFNAYVARGAAQVGQQLNSATLAQSAQVAGSGTISGSSVSSAAAMAGTQVAGAQQTLDALLMALGEKQTINIQQIINKEMNQNGGGNGGGAGPKRTTPSGSDRSSEAANHATGN